MGRGGIPSGYYSLTQAAEVAGVRIPTLERAARRMKLAAYCVGCRKQLTQMELMRGHACPNGPTWGSRNRVMISKYAAQTFKPSPLHAKAARARWKPKVDAEATAPSR